MHANEKCGILFKKMLPARPKEYLKMFYGNINFGLGYFMLYIVLVILAGVFGIKVLNKKNRFDIIIFLLALFIVGNATIVAFASRAMRRYFFYFDIIWILIPLILIITYSYKGKNFIQRNTN